MSVSGDLDDARQDILPVPDQAPGALARLPKDKRGCKRLRTCISMLKYTTESAHHFRESGQSALQPEQTLIQKWAALPRTKEGLGIPRFRTADRAAPCRPQVAMALQFADVAFFDYACSAKAWNKSNNITVNHIYEYTHT